MARWRSPLLSLHLPSHHTACLLQAQFFLQTSAQEPPSPSTRTIIIHPCRFFFPDMSPCCSRWTGSIAYQLSPLLLSQGLSSAQQAQGPLHVLLLLKDPSKFPNTSRMSSLMHQDPYSGPRDHGEEAFLHHPGLLAFLTSSPSLSLHRALSSRNTSCFSTQNLDTPPPACCTLPPDISRNTSFPFRL